MAVETSPGFIQANTYSAEILRRAMYAMLARGASIGSVAGGIIAATDLQTTYAGSGLNVTVSAGECVVPGSSTSTQSGYYLRGSSATALTPAAANPSNPRIDLIYAQVQDAAYTGASNLGTIAIATGTPTAGATLINLNGAPSLPTSALALGYVQVPAAAGTISNANISNVAALALSGLLTAGRSYTLAGVTCTTVAASGNATVGGTLGVTGAFTGSSTGSFASVVTLPGGIKGMTAIPAEGATQGTIGYEQGTAQAYYAANARHYFRAESGPTWQDAYANTFNPISDGKLKKNVKAIQGALDKIAKLRPVSFDWKHNDESSLGLIAQEVREVFPEVVIEAPEAEGEPTLAVNYNALVGPLLAAVQELIARVEGLEAQLAK